MYINIEVVTDNSRYGTVLNEVEAETIKQVHEQCRWNQSATARKLGISRGCLRAKLRQYWGERYLTTRSK